MAVEGPLRSVRFFYFLFFPLISFLCLGRICADSSPLKYRVTSVAFSPDGKQVVSGSWDKSVKLWNVETGKELSTMKVYAGDFGVQCVTFNGTGDTIVAGCWNGNIFFIDTATSQVREPPLTCDRYDTAPLYYCPVCGHFTAKCFHAVTLNQAD